jgi:CheY-like chemotaxis protein
MPSKVDVIRKILARLSVTHHKESRSWKLSKDGRDVDTECTKILFVDDEQTIADTLALIFSTRGYDTRVAYSAEEALELITAWLPDLAILDVVLSKMPGTDLAVLLTQKVPNCQILLLSGQVQTSDLLAETEKKGHTFALLAKPIHPTLLLSKALELLSGIKEN